MRLLDHVLAVHDCRVARGTVVEAPPEVVYEAALEIDPVSLWRRDPIARVLSATARAPVPSCASLRELPDRGIWIRLAEEPGREFVFGAMGRVRGRRVEGRESEADGFTRFWDRGWGKLALAFTVHHAGDRRTVLVCEARTAATDPYSGRRLRRSWMLIKPGVWLMLGRMLAATRREAEARSGRPSGARRSRSARPSRADRTPA